MENKLKQLERAFPELLFDVNYQLATNQVKIVAFNPNRFSNFKDPQREEYLLNTEDNIADIANLINQDFYEK